MRRFFATALVFICTLSLIAAPQDAQPAHLTGFSDQNARTERDWEQKFRALPRADLAKQYARRLAAHPHHVGSPYDKDNAEWLLATFKSWGLDSHIENFDVLMPTP